MPAICTTKATLPFLLCGATLLFSLSCGVNPASAAPPAAAPAASQAPDQSEITIGPMYTNAPELTVAPDVPRGTVHDFTMESTDSKIYPGIAKNQPGTVPYQRKVAVYIPQQYVPGTPAPFIVVHDGMWYRDVLPPVLDSMIAQGRLPVMIAVLVHNGGGDAQGSERGLEYDTVSGTYATFIETEVLPRISKDYNVTFTKDPEGRATMGGSSGGSAAFSMAWFHPEWYHRVLTYSGTYVNQQSPLNPETPHGAWEYHEHLIPQSPRKPLRIWLEVSENDNGSKRDEASLHNWVMANQRMAAALKAKGYSYQYVFAQAAGHTDGRVTKQTLPSALEWLWKGYPITPSRKVVAYVPNWIDLSTFVDKIDYARLTHINVAFENPVNDSGEMSYSKKNDVLIERAHANKIPVLISIGGGAASGNKELLARYFHLIKDDNRAAFVAKLTDYVVSHNFDGLDVDLEGPSINEDYGAFVQDLGAALKAKGKLMTAALSQGYGGNKVPDSTFTQFDFVNIMAYDGAGYWNPNAPGQHSSLDFARSNVAYWLGRGLPKSKAVLGVPFYGYGFGDAFRKRSYSYSEVVASYPGAENQDQVGKTIWYNGIPTIQAKAQYVRDEGLAGLMIWSLDNDVPGARSLLSAMDATLKAPPAAPTVATPAPKKAP